MGDRWSCKIINRRVLEYPKHTCKNISIKGKGLGKSYSLELPMSQNLPDYMKFKNFETVFDTLNMKEGIFDADSNYFKKDTSEIILTVLDQV